MTRMSAADVTPLIGSEPMGSFVTTYDVFANLVPWASALGGPSALVDAQEVLIWKWATTARESASTKVGNYQEISA